MRSLVARPVLSKEETAALLGTKLDDSHYRTLIDGEDVDVMLEDGTPLLKYRVDCLPAAECNAAYAVLHPLHSPPTNRPTATIGKSSQFLRSDGVRSNTVRINTREHPKVNRTSSAVIGYYDRYVRFPYCRATAFNLNQPDRFAAALPFIQAVDRVFKQEMPDRHAAQMAKVAETSPDFVIHGTSFTTITVNKNWQTSVHVDAGDLGEGFGVMTALRGGEFTGGYLVFPRYGLAVNLGTRCVLLANVHEYHGNTPIVGKPGTYRRVSCVLYYRSRMVECGSAAEELERVKNRKRGDALYD